MSQAGRSPRLVIIAGGNGAGKSTFYRLYLEPRGLPLINADEIARELWPGSAEAHSYQAMLLAQEARKQALLAGRSFCFESVFSHPAKVDFVAEARQRGYEIHLYIIHLAHPRVNLGRVEQRVAQGGHAVPDEKVVRRIPRSINNLKRAAARAHRAVLLDNSRYDNPFIPQAQCREGRWEALTGELAPWASDFSGL